MRSTWDDLSAETRKIIEETIGHPIIASSEFVSWNRDYVKPGTEIHRRLMYDPPKNFDIDDRIYKDYIEKIKTIPGKTFLVGFSQRLGRSFAELATGETITEVDGTTTTSITISGIQSFCGVLSGAASSTYGLTVGSGSNAVTRTDTQLQTKIAHGATAGTLQYGAVSVGAVSNPSGTISRFQVTRTFTGNAGSTATINEDGLEGIFSSTNVYMLAYRNVNSFGAVSAAQVVTATINVDTTS